ncbi:MAG: hypothetical protein LBE56_12460 [Tannerella sp.]|nr:hypothetical protein [Tannerella sp.]
MTGCFVSWICGIITQEYTEFTDKMVFALCGIYGFAGITLFNLIIDVIRLRLMKGEGEGKGKG